MDLKSCHRKKSWKNTGVGCHFLLQCMKVKSESEVAQLCPTLSDHMDLCIGLHFTALTLHLESSCVWLKSLEKWKWLQILPYSSCGEIELIFLTWTWAGLWQLRSVDCGSSDNHASFGCVWELKPSSAVVSESSMMTWRKHEKALCWHDMPALPERPHREGWRITRREVRSG